MMHDTKIAINLRDDLPVWKQSNVIAVTISGIVGIIESMVMVDQPQGRYNSLEGKGTLEKAKATMVQSNRNKK